MGSVRASCISLLNLDSFPQWIAEGLKQFQHVLVKLVLLPDVTTPHVNNYFGPCQLVQHNAQLHQLYKMSKQVANCARSLQAVWPSIYIYICTCEYIYIYTYIYIYGVSMIFNASCFCHILSLFSVYSPLMSSPTTLGHLTLFSRGGAKVDCSFALGTLRRCQKCSVAKDPLWGSNHFKSHAAWLLVTSVVPSRYWAPESSNRNESVPWFRSRLCFKYFQIRSFVSECV